MSEDNVTAQRSATWNRRDRDPTQTSNRSQGSSSSDIPWKASPPNDIPHKARPSTRNQAVSLSESDTPDHSTSNPEEDDNRRGRTVVVGRAAVTSPDATSARQQSPDRQQQGNSPANSARASSPHTPAPPPEVAKAPGWQYDYHMGPPPKPKGPETPKAETKAFRLVNAKLAKPPGLTRGQ